VQPPPPEARAALRELFALLSQLGGSATATSDRRALQLTTPPLEGSGEVGPNQ